MGNCPSSFHVLCQSRSVQPNSLDCSFISMTPLQLWSQVQKSIQKHILKPTCICIYRYIYTKESCSSSNTSEQLRWTSLVPGTEQGEPRVPRSESPLCRVSPGVESGASRRPNPPRARRQRKLFAFDQSSRIGWSS